ncbi:MAG TPA: glucans biosynthesis glucosyltransferase MdoH [Candidatus Sulfotelmatobacter sp.]|nr:glucans biosynthesis glucosyltransferase MdoH [Candidatus Sulfotelmatobacter sp.]
MQLHRASGLSSSAAALCRRYLDRLPLTPQQRGTLAQHVDGESDPMRALARLHRALAGLPGPAGHAALASVPGRLALGRSAGDASAASSKPLAAEPPLCRRPMAPTGWPTPLVVRMARTVRAWARRSGPGSRRPGLPDASPADKIASRVAGVRRSALLALVLGQTAAGSYLMAAVLPYHAGRPLELAVLILFTILFGWVSVGFWTAMAGFLVLWRGYDRFAVSRSASPEAPIPAEARTAVIMPIRNEHVARVFAGLRATYESVAATGWLDRFHFFVLSDTSEADVRVAEIRGWLDLCAAVGGVGRVFYRWRTQRIKGKSGNVADFCRRWGSRYRYMVVLDADSIMSGTCLAMLVRLMEAHPTAGIIQTAPRPAGRDTLYARIQQFATRAYGPMFTAGLHFWHLGEAYYWGHNAIIRVAPFMRHCALGRLPGRGPLSGDILSHDFVEAALMRGAGWKVWMAYDLPGSYEEMPPNLADELKRDRRWCLGNLINSRLLLAEGLHPAHRAIFMTGIMAYLSAPLWLLSLGICTALMALQALVGPQYFVQPRQLFPVWPEWHPEWAVGLAAATAIVLFAPKVLSVALAVARGAREFGGGTRLALSLLLELMFSALLAPVRMLFHTKFVLAALTGRRTPWKSPPREDVELSWGEALHRHGAHTLLGVLWGMGVYWLDPAYVWWLVPVVGALALSMPVSVYSSRVSLGRALRRAGLLLIPEETQVPSELRQVRRYLAEAPALPRFVDAVVDPLVNAMACAASLRHPKLPVAISAARQRAIEMALHSGPSALTDFQKHLLLSDPAALSELHLQVWTSPAAHQSWFAGSARRMADAPLAFRLAS